MKIELKMILLVTGVLLFNACSTRNAALLATIPGQAIGVPLGMTLTAIDETFKTAKEVVDANPRYDKQKPVHQAGYSSSRRLPEDVQDTHYYKTEVLIKTRGPADIQSVELIDSEDVTEFWR